MRRRRDRKNKRVGLGGGGIGLRQGGKGAETLHEGEGAFVMVVLPPCSLILMLSSTLYCAHLLLLLHLYCLPGLLMLC